MSYMGLLVDMMNHCEREAKKHTEGYSGMYDRGYAQAMCDMVQYIKEMEG